MVVNASDLLNRFLFSKPKSVLLFFVGDSILDDLRIVSFTKEAVIFFPTKCRP
jgi:hypothetical protein